MLADAVEDDDRVVDRVAEDRQQGRDGGRGQLAAGQRVHAQRDQDVVQERAQDRDCEAPLEAERDVQRDEDETIAMMAPRAIWS